tara:strand:+ start:153289 stop:153453 length:165 start_codon:yes stop_codon:yes gene_type:complete
MITIEKYSIGKKGINIDLYIDYFSKDQLNIAKTARKGLFCCQNHINSSELLLIL